MPIEVRTGVVIPDASLEWRFSRSSGPGGQGVNTTDSRVELALDLETTPGISDFMRQRAIERIGPRVTIIAQENRSQLANREAAIVRLRETLKAATAPPPKKRRPTKPSRGSIESRIQSKKQRSQTKNNRRKPTSSD